MSGESQGPSGTESAPRARLLAALVLLLALAHGLHALADWSASGTVVWARSPLDPWPLAALSIAALLGLRAALVRASLPRIALAALGWSLAVEACRELPEFSASRWAGDGPVQVPLLLAIALGGGLWILARSGSDWGDGASRAAALLTLWTTGGLKLFTRDGEAVYALFAAGVVLSLFVWGGALGLRQLLFGRGARVAWIALGLLIWWTLAAAQGDSPQLGVGVVLRLVSGALLAWCLAAVLALEGTRGLRRVYGALLVGLGLGLAALVLVLFDMAQFNPWSRLLGWRLRLFGLHPNQIGPFFAVGALLAGALALARGPRGGWLRPGPLALALLAGAALLWTRSAASLGGFALGASVFGLGLARRLPRRGGLLLAGLLLAGGLGVAVFASDLGDPARDWLDRRAQGQDALGQRWHFWKMAWASLEEEPWFGLGPNQYYAHTRFAEPSYYSGTNQALHPHNIVLAAGESAGFPGMLLFAALMLALLELGRRAVLFEGHPDRVRYHAGLLAGLVALLAANLLDLGQSQNTFVPLFGWLALGVFGAPGCGPPGEPRARGGGALAAALAWVALVAIGPLLSGALTDRGKRGLQNNEPELAASCYRWALRLQPWNERAQRARVNALRSTEAILAAREEECRAAPARGRSWLQLGRELLKAGQPRRALEALVMASELDPEGPYAGDIAFGRAWARLSLGQTERAREQLLVGLRTTGMFWRSLPSRELEDGAGRGDLVFVAARGPAQEELLSLDELLDELVEEALALQGAEPADPVGARRLIGRVVAVQRARGHTERALEALTRYAEAAPSGRLLSNDMLWAELLGELGRYDEALAIADGNPEFANPHARTTLVQALRESPDPEHRQRVRELAPGVEEFAGRDIFFDAGLVAPLFELLGELALEDGDVQRALWLHRAAIWDEERSEGRVRVAERLLQRALEADLDDAHLLGVLELLVLEASRDRQIPRRPQRVAGWARRVLEGWSGERAQLVRAVEAFDAGAVGPLLVAELRRGLR